MSGKSYTLSASAPFTAEWRKSHHEDAAQALLAAWRKHKKDWVVDGIALGQQIVLDRGGLVDRLVGGFQVTAIHRYRSGPALVPFIGGGQREFLQRVGFLGNLRPNVTGQSFYTENPSGGVDYRYLNPGAFSRPTDFGAAPPFSLDGGATVNPAYAAYYADPLRFFGNAAPTYGSLRATPFFTEDLSIMKKTRVTETTYVEIRFEVFNLFNRGRYGLPNMNLDDGNFGISARNADIFQPRRIQVGGRFVF